MEILLYIIKSTALLGLFFLVYEFLLKRDTFFTLNRYFLIAGILVAAVLPILTFTKTHVVEVSMRPVATLNLETLDNYSSLSQGVPIENPSFWASIDFIQIFVYLYFLGTIFFLTKFLISLIKLRRILKYRPKTYLKNGIRFIETDRETNPFTFFKTVVYNPELHADDDLEMILQHERIHARNWHSIDILLGQLIVAFHWFNPLVWRYSKSIDQNLEFIADYKTTKVQFPKKSYQMTLLRTALPSHLSLPVNYFYSFTKTRILMLNKNQSHSVNRLKALLVLPFLMIFLMSFQIETKTKIKKITSSEISQDSIPNNKVDILNMIIKTADANTVLFFNGKETTINKIEPSLYKVENVGYNKGGIPFIQAKDSKDETLKLQLRNLSKGVYLQVSENASLAILTRNDGNGKNHISVFPGEKLLITNENKNQKDSDGPEDFPKRIVAQSSSSVNISREELMLERNNLKDSLKNRHKSISVEVLYELKEEKQEKREELNRKRMEIKDSLRISISNDTTGMRAQLQQETKAEKEKRSNFKKIRSAKVSRDGDSIYIIMLDKNEEVIVLRFEMDEYTSDSSLDEIVSKFADAGVDFKYKVVKRDRAGKILRISMTLNRGEGSQAKINNQSSDGIGSYLLGLNYDGSIYITAKN